MAKVVLLLLLLCTLLMPQHSYGADINVLNLGNRKVVGGLEMKKMVQQKEVGELGMELREAPMGPDPLHHNGAPPRKPRTTP